MRFTIRDLFWLVLLAAVLCLWWRHDRAKTNQMNALIRGKATAESYLQTVQNRLTAVQQSKAYLEALVKRDRRTDDERSN